MSTKSLVLKTHLGILTSPGVSWRIRIGFRIQNSTNLSFAEGILSWIKLPYLTNLSFGEKIRLDLPHLTIFFLPAKGTAFIRWSTRIVGKIGSIMKEELDLVTRWWYWISGLLIIQLCGTVNVASQVFMEWGLPLRVDQVLETLEHYQGFHGQPRQDVLLNRNGRPFSDCFPNRNFIFSRFHLWSKWSSTLKKINKIEPGKNYRTQLLLVFPSMFPSVKNPTRCYGFSCGIWLWRETRNTPFFLLRADWCVIL